MRHLFTILALLALLSGQGPRAIVSSDGNGERLMQLLLPAGEL